MKLNSIWKAGLKHFHNFLSNSHKTTKARAKNATKLAWQRILSARCREDSCQHLGWFTSVCLIYHLPMPRDSVPGTLRKTLLRLAFSMAPRDTCPPTRSSPGKMIHSRNLEITREAPGSLLIPASPFGTKNTHCWQVLPYTDFLWIVSRLSLLGLPAPSSSSHGANTLSLQVLSKQ